MVHNGVTDKCSPPDYLIVKLDMRIINQLTVEDRKPQLLRNVWENTLIIRDQLLNY